VATMVHGTIGSDARHQ